MEQTEAFRLVFGDSGAAGDQSLPAREAALAWLRQQPALHAVWLAGLSYSDHAPADVICRLLNRGRDSDARRDWFWLTYRDLPTEVFECAAGHSDRHVRSAAAENPGFPADLLPRLAHGTDAERDTVALIVAFHEVPADIAIQLARASDVRIRRRLAQGNSLPHESRIDLLNDPEPTVRAAILPQLWAELTGEEQARLAADADPDIVEAVAKAGVAPITTLEQFRAATGRAALADAAATAVLDRQWAQALVIDEREWVRCYAATNPSLPPDLVSALADDPDPGVREYLARRPELAADLVERLARDPENLVRLEISVRPDLTDEQRQAIDYTIPGGRQPIYAWVEELHGDPEAMRRLARSSHPLIRRAVAAAQRLPADVIELLSRDEDLFVKLTLAQYCDDAPPQLMVDVYEQWDGKWAFALLHRPTFPRHGLAYLAEHPEYLMRALAVRDPLLEAETVLRLEHYEDPRVPLAVAVDNLHLVRAVQHPGISPAAMHLMLDLAGFP